MRRLEWRRAIWLWGLIAVFLSADIYSAMSGRSGGQARRASAVTDKSEVSRKEIALTFDDGPHPVYTRKLLDGLKERGVKATLFLIGKTAKENPKLVRRIDEEGHLIGNHTYNHVEITRLSD